MVQYLAVFEYDTKKKMLVYGVSFAVWRRSIP